MTVLAGADAWEQLQLRQRQLAIAQVLPLSSDGKTTAPDKPHDQPEPWEDDLGEKWSAMQHRLETQLRANVRNAAAPSPCFLARMRLLIVSASTDPASGVIVNASKRREA